MSVEPATLQVISDSNRKVWVLNDYSEAYVEVFRGETITVPPNGEKRLAMNYLAAERFLSQPVMPAEASRLPNGQYTVPPKMLRIVEMTDEEYEEYTGGKRPVADTKKAELTCTLCGFQAVSSKGLKIHTTKEHPHDVPVEDEELHDTSAISRGGQTAA